ncbi:hypothetical protein Pogu_0513 [Pyrobaculum oguniense TE7]|uniref:Uncharacterized protein n=1 Tax=Pyrobaculum oguniense (strain DSM 13380 / JCM 10595 / TE7) TaxID=698757 RepID=H6Q776_PYROT|nr:hypothetical protein Pogu_0513 [Pyrobaculum oguniense TE7]
MESCHTAVARLRRLVNSKLRSPSETKAKSRELIELGVFLGYIHIGEGFYHFFYNERFNKVMRFKHVRNLSPRKFFKSIYAQVAGGTLSLYPSVGTIIPRKGSSSRVVLKLRSAPFNGRIPLYADNGLLEPILCSAVVPTTGFTTAAVEIRRGLTRVPFAVVAVRPDKLAFQGFDVIIKTGATTLKAVGGYTLRGPKRGDCAVLAVDLSTCIPQRTVYLLSSYTCDAFTQAPLCKIWGFRVVEARMVYAEVERLLSAGAEPNSLLPVVDRECVSKVDGSARRKLLECAKRISTDVLLPTEEYVKTCGVRRRTIEVLNTTPSQLDDCVTA